MGGGWGSREGGGESSEGGGGCSVGTREDRGQGQPAAYFSVDQKCQVTNFVQKSPCVQKVQNQTNFANYCVYMGENRKFSGQQGNSVVLKKIKSC